MKKTLSLVFCLFAFLAIVSMSACADKAKKENTPNIDSLVDAKVNERLKEASQEEELLNEEEKESIAEIDNFDALEGIEGLDDLEDEDVDEEEEDDVQLLEGTIGRYPITMRLNSLSGCDDGDYVGHYVYDERPGSKFSLQIVSMEAINTKGSMHLVLKEYTSKGNHTGTFRGQYECRGDHYSGTFINSKGEKFEFELH